MRKLKWVPTPTFLYRNYLYEKVARSINFGKEFIDVGSGNGYFLKKLAEAGYHGEAIDISKEAVRVAKSILKENKSVNIKVADVFKYHKEREVDVVFSFETLEHIEDDLGAMKTMYQLLRKGGAFVLSVPAHQSLWSKVDEIKGHYRRYERKELVDKLKSAGFRISYVWTYGFPFLSLIRKFSGGGKLIKTFGKWEKMPKLKSASNDVRGRESSIQEEYPPFLASILTNPILWFIPFKIMDLFVNTDLGFGYIVVARK